MTKTNAIKILASIIGSGTLIVTIVKIYNKIIRTKKSQKEYPKDVVIVFQFPRIPEAPSMSPFPIKLETYLRMAKIPYQNEYGMKMSPKNKIPWIMYNGEIVSDSQFIIEFLNKKFDVDLNKHLAKQEKAVAHSMRKMTEESFFWTLSVLRFVYDFDESYILKRMPVNRFILWRICSYVKKMTYYQGYGRHSREEIEIICRQDLQALSSQIGNNQFLMGNQPCEEDCAIFGMLATLWLMPEHSIFTKILKENTYPNLVTYFEKMKKAFWPDYHQES